MDPTASISVPSLGATLGGEIIVAMVVASVMGAVVFIAKTVVRRIDVLEKNLEKHETHVNQRLQSLGHEDRAIRQELNAVSLHAIEALSKAADLMSTSVNHELNSPSRRPSKRDDD